MPTNAEVQGWVERSRFLRSRWDERYTSAIEAQVKLNKAFQLLRKQGLIAKQRFACCRGCAGCRLANDITETLDKGGKRPLGAVFYTKQDGFFDNPKGRHPKPRKLYLTPPSSWTRATASGTRILVLVWRE